MSFSRLQNDSATFRWGFKMCDYFFVVWMSIWLFSFPVSIATLCTEESSVTHA